MRYFFPFLMALLIVSGLFLTITPFVADYFMPVPDKQTRTTKEQQLRNALARWFNTDSAQFLDVQGIEKRDTEKKIAFYAFSIDREPVARFVTQKKLVQKAFTEQVFNDIFYQNKRPASWWQPEALGAETWFTGFDQQRYLHLSYNPKTRRCLLVIEQRF